jgi:uncharacterized phage protein gp47/JayE
VALIIPTLEEIETTMWRDLRASTGITEESESGIARNIVRVLAFQQHQAWIALQSLDNASNPLTAAGSDLDKLGDLFGVTRLSAKKSITTGTGQAIKLTNLTGSVVNVPAGTRVWSVIDPSLAFYTTLDSGLISNGGEAFVDVQAALTGSRYNVGVGQIDSINIKNIQVTNILPIGGGTEVESDNNFRIRILSAVTTLQGANQTSVRMRLLEIPQVSDVLVRNLARGTGTVDVVLYTTDVSPDTQAIIKTEAQRILDETVALGVSAEVKFPTILWVDFSVSLSIKPGSDLRRARVDVASSIRGYIDNLPIATGGTDGNLIFNELISRVQDSNPAILDSELNLKVNGQRVLQMNQTADIGERFFVRQISFN